MFSWFFNSSKGEGGEAPRFVLPLSPIRASDGEPTKLICTLTGKPIPQITWYCGQREIRPSRDFQPAFEPTTGAASLTIAEVFPDDEGVYRCRATNTHGTAECEAALTVGDMIVVSHQELVRAPVIAQPLEPDQVETGSRKVMTIRFDGYPTPEVKWYHNGREIQQTENRLVTTFKNESTLVVVRCDADSAGKYEARAMNEGGEARTSASVQLADGKVTAQQQPPKFRKALRPQIVPESEAIVMEVEVDSAPECVFSWKQHGAVVQSTEAMQIVTQNNRSTLFIPESFVENSGIYTVKAENAAGSVASTATLTVERQLLAEEFTPPFIVKELPQTKVMDGEEVRLICQVNGTPMPRIKWYHNGQPVREHNGVMMSLSPQGEAVLRLAEAFPEDAGVYECKAVNRAGQITTSTTLQVERYEYIPDSESASITAGPSVGTWEDLTGPSGSEDDLLSDKPVVNKKSVKTKTEKKSAKFQPQESKEEELVKDSGSAPRFVVALPRQVDVKDGQQARFEVKVESYPRPSVFWYLNGKEIQPSKDFGIDHLEDGTSILTLGEVYPEDAGELMCEAHNDKGVVTSITHLNVTEYKDTPTYRKPEWVTKMEIVRAQMLESIQPPQFTTEIVDARVQEGEEAKFECHYAGNPKPDICWYFNNKLLNPNPNIKIRITDSTTSCTFLEVDQDLEGEYMCKATSNSGSHVTKARLHVHELTGEAKKVWLAKKAKVEEEKVRVKKEKEDKKHKKDKGAKLTKEEYLKQAMHEKELAKAEEAKKLAAVEEAKLAKEEAEKQPKPKVKINKAKAQREAMIEEGLSKFVETQALGLKALLEMTERKSLNVTEVVAQDKAKEFVADEAPFKEFVQIETMLKSGVTVDQIVTLGALGNLPTLTAPETQKALVRLVEDQGFRAVVLQGIVKEVVRLAPEEPIGMKAVLKAIETKSANMEDIVVMATHPEEFNLEAHPVPEMATVSTLLNEGISCEEMLTIVKAGELPALNLPENQWALVQIMDKLGQSAIVSQVIVEEPALNLPAEINEIPQTVEERLDKFVTNQSIGLRALIDLSIQESINVSEMATLDRVQEFPPDQAPFQEFVNIDTMLKSGVKVDQIVALGSTGNLPVLTAPETQKALVRIVEDHGSRAIVREITVKEAAKLLPEEAIGLKAVLKAVKTKKADIKNIVEMAIHPEEFGLEAIPVPEMASVSTLLHEGISCEEMLTIVKAGELPALKLPETQWPLIQIMDRLGQTAMVSQTIIEEPMLGLKIEIPELATSVESTVEPLSTAVVEVLPDEPSAIATLETNEDNVPEWRKAKKKKNLQVIETPLTQESHQPLNPEPPKDLVTSVKQLAEEEKVTTKTSTEAVSLKMSKVKKSVKVDADIHSSKMSTIPKDEVSVVIQSSKRKEELINLPAEVVKMTVEPKIVTRVNIETPDLTPSITDFTTKPTQKESSPLKNQETIQLEPTKKTETEITPEAAKPLKKAKTVQKRELATFEVEKVTLKPIKRQSVTAEEKDEKETTKDLLVIEVKRVPREEFPEENIERVDAGIQLKKKSIATKPLDKESIEQCPEATPFQQEYQIESIRKDQPEGPKYSPEILLKNVAVVEQKKETTEPLNLKSFHSIEPTLAKQPSPLVVEDVVEVSKIEIKKTPKLREAEISLASESVVVEQPGTSAQLELKAEMTLPVDMQPEELKSVKIEPLQVSEDVIPAKDIEIKKKSRIRKTEISLASDSVPIEQVKTVEPLKIKSEITLPTDIKYLEPVPLMTESVTGQESSVKQTVIKKKTEIKSNQQLASESITTQPPEKTEQFELKTEIMVPSHAKEFKQEMVEPQEEVFTIVKKKKIPGVKKSEISLAPESVSVEEPETTQLLTLKSDLTLPSYIQSKPTESVQAITEVSTVAEIKKKPRTKKSEISVVPESVTVHQPETEHPLTLKSELTLASNIQPDEIKPLMTESTKVIQDIPKEVEVKRKPRNQKSEISLAPESHLLEQFENAEPLEKKRVKPLKVEFLEEDEKLAGKHQETKPLLIKRKESSDFQTEKRLVAQQTMPVTTFESQENKTHQSEMTLEPLSMPKVSKSILKKVSITAEVLPQQPSTDIVIETKSSKRATAEMVSAVDQAQMITMISQEPTMEMERSETSQLTLVRQKQPEVATTKIEPIESHVTNKQDIPQDISVQAKLKKTKTTVIDDSTKMQTINITQAQLNIGETTSSSATVMDFKRSEEPQESITSKSKIEEFPVQVKLKKKSITTVVQSTSQKEVSELPLQRCELPEKPDEQISQIETTKLELKRPKESTKKEVPEVKEISAPVLPGMSIETISKKRDTPTEVAVVTLEQPKETSAIFPDVEVETATQEFTIQTKSKQTIQPVEVETFDISLSSKMIDTEPLETAQMEESAVIKKSKETTVKRKSKKVSREHREATPVAPLVPAEFSEVVNPTLEQVMVDECQPMNEEYAEIRFPETQKATVVQQTMPLDSSGDFSAIKLPSFVSAKPKLNVQEGLQCEEIQVIPFQSAIISKKAEAVSACVEMVSAFPLEVGEIQTFNKPEKYVPALFVATEKARPRLTTESALITTETRAPEREGSYTAGRLPPTQQANVALSLRESTSVSLDRLHESECILVIDRTGETATTAIEPIHSIVAVVNRPESQLTAEELHRQPESIKQVGKMSIIPHESVVRDETHTTEREVTGVVKLPISALERAEPVMVTSKSLSVHTQQPYQSGEVLEMSSVIPSSKTAKKVQEFKETVSSYQVVVDEATGSVEETKTPAGQEATTDCVALESAATTQKITYESEGDWTKADRLPSLSAPKSTMEALSVAQTDSTVSVDKESALTLPVLPETNQASSKMDSFMMLPRVSAVDTLQATEPFTQPVVALEMPKVVGSAGQSLPSIQQVYVEEATAKFKPMARPDAKQATQIHDENAQSSAQTGETWTHESVTDTLPVLATSDQAHVSLQPHLAVVQLSVVPSSAGDIFKEETPLSQSAKTDLVPLQSIASSHQTPSHEREGQILSHPTIPALTASLSVQNPMESSVNQEIQTGFKEQFLPQFSRPELDMASFTVSGDNRSLLPVTAEVGSDECLASYVVVPVPTAESRLIHDVQQSIRVMANEPVEREVEFVSDTIPKQQTITQTAHLVTSGSVVTSEVRPEQMPSTFQQPISDIIPQAFQACRVFAQPTIQPITLTETATSESLAPMQTQRPVESKAALELPEQQSLLVSQHQLVERETVHPNQLTPQKQQGKVKLATREALVTDQQQQVQHGSDYQVVKPTAVSLEAKIVPNNQGKAAQVTETQTGSFAGQLQTADRVEETAQLSLASMETATVSHVWDYRKEADWVPASVQPAKKTAQAITMSDLRSVQVEQTQTVEAEGQLNVAKAVMADSTSSVTSMLETPSLYSTQVFQKEKPLEEFVAGQSQSARPVSPTKKQNVQISEVQTSIHEGPLDLKRPVEQTAKASIPQSEVVVKREDIIMDYVLPQKETPVESATPSVSFTKQHAVSVGHVVESGIQSGLAADLKPEEKTAIRLIPEHVQTAVASVQVAYKEGLLEDFVTAQSQMATTKTDKKRTVVVSEVQSELSEIPLENQTRTVKFAVPSQPVQEAPVTQEVTIMDFTTPKTMDSVVQERPTVNVTEQRAVSVQQVVEGSTTTELVPEVTKKTKKASRAQLERTEISVRDVQVAFKEAPLEELSAGQTQSARLVKEEQRTIQISQVQTEMKEEPLEISAPVSKTAVSSVPEKQAVVISRDVLMDFTVPQTAKAVVESETSVVGITEHRAVNVAQVVEASSETQLIPETKRKSEKASRILPEKTETSVFQVEAEDKEAPMEAFFPVPSKLANLSTDEQKTVQVTQVVSEQRETPLESQLPVGRRAKMDVQEAVARTTQEQVTFDMSIPQKPTTTETETAFVVLPEKKALSVGTVVVSSAEFELTPRVKAEKKTAKASFSPSEAIVSSQDLLMDTIEHQAEQKVELEKPVVKVTEQLAVNVGQVIEGLNETELVTEVKKKTKKATRVLSEKNETSIHDVQVAFKEAPMDEFVQVPAQLASKSAPEEKRTVQVTEVQTGVSTVPLPATRRPSTETIKAKLPENQAAVQHETVAMDFTVPKSVPTVIEETPTVSVTEQRAVSVGQVIEGLTGTELAPEVKKKTKKATRVLPEKTETIVSGVQLAFKEATIEDFTAGQSQTAFPVADERKTLEISQVQSEIKEQILDIKKPIRKRAKTNLPEVETAVVTQNIAMDYTVPQTAKVVGTEKPVVTVTEQRAVSVSHVVEGSSEAELLPEAKPKTRKASRTLPLPSEQISVAQVQFTEKVGDLDRLPDAVQASAQDVPAVKEMVDVAEKVFAIAPEEEISFSDDSFQSLSSSTSTLIEDTMMTAASSLEDLVVDVAQLPEVIQEEEVEASIVLPTSQEETVSEEFSIGLKPKPEPQVEFEEFQATLKLAKDVVDVTATKKIVKKKKKPVTEDNEESVTIQVTKTVEQVEESAATFKLKPKISPEIPVEDVKEEYVIKKPKETVETVEESTLLTLKKSVKPYQVEEIEDSVNVASIRKVEPVAVEGVEQGATLKLKPVKVVERENVEEQFQIGLKPVKPKEQVEDVEEKLTIKPKRKTSQAVEEASASLNTVVQAEDVTLKMVQKEEVPYQVEEIEEEIQVKPIIKKKRTKVVAENVESDATFKLKETVVAADDVEDVEEQFQIGLKPVKPKEQVEDVEEKLTIKPKRKTSQAVEEASASLKTVVQAEDVPQDVTLKIVQKEEVPYRVEEIEDEFQVKPILKKKKKVIDQDVESGATLKLKEQVVAVDDAEDVEEQFQIGLKPKRKPKVQIQTDGVEGEAAVTLKRPAKSVVIQETTEAATLVIQQQQPADDDSLLTTTDQSSEYVTQQFSDSGVVSITDVIIQPKKTKKSYRVEDVEDAFAVQARNMKDSLEGDDVEGGANFKLKLESEMAEDVQEEFSLGLKPRRLVKPSISVEADESLRFKIPARPKVSAPTLTEEGNTLTVARAATSILADAEEETTMPLEPQEGDEFFSLCSYVADTEEAMNLVEGERVYVLEWHNSDWWFVRKHLTEETGWVPAQYLKDDTSYTHYVKKKLDEKINKLPVFDFPTADETKIQAPRFLTKLQPVRAPDGSSITFECQVEGSPRPVITWFRQTAVIKPSLDFQMVYDEEGNMASLTIAEVFPEDAGTFTCVAKNSAGFASSSAELIVEAPLSDHGSDTTITSRRSLSRESSLMDILEGIPPTFSQRPKTKTVDEGTDVELECRLVAVPEPDVAWFHNGKRIKPSDRIALLGQSDVHMYCSIIQIKDVQMGDEGTYDIIARNREGEAVSHVVLNVKVKGARKAPPQLEQQLKNSTVQIGNPVILTAKVTGIPTPVVKWYRNGVEIQTNVKTDEKGISTLTIAAAQPEDDGDYMLNAENEHGQVQTSATLTVQLPSKLQFVEKFKDMSVEEGEPFVMRATFTVIPTELAWYRNGKRLKATKSLKITSDGLVHTLQVSSASVEKETGEYKCVASNSSGTKISHTANVKVECNIFVQPLEDVEVDAGSDVVLLCRTKEPTEVNWYRNDVLLPPLLPGGDDDGPVQESRDREHKLTLRRVGKKETGRYSCTFENQSTACVFTVRAEPAHEFTAKIKDLEIKERQPAVFTAEVSDEKAQVTWHKDGEPLDQTNTERYEFVSEALKRSFTIRSVTLQDEGEYTCSLAEQECTAELVVIELPPEITLRLKDVTVRRGEEASFEIELTKGDAKIQWFRNSEEIQLSEHIQLAIDGKRQRLVIYDSGPEDACEYSCVIGDQKSAAQLTVLAPRVNFVAKLPEVVAAPMGQDVTFTVQLTGEEADVTWMKNGEVVVESDRIKLNRDGCSRSLTITKAVIEDSAEYTCVLEAMKTVTVLTVEVPKVPPSIPIDQVHAEVWVRRGEDAVIEIPFNGFPTPKAEWTFKGKAIRKTKKSVYTISETSAQLTLKLVDENEAGVYTCKLSNECGDVSVSVTIKLMEKPCSPSVPECLETADDSITIMWKPPGYNGGSTIINYIVEYQEKQTKKWITANKDVVITETTYMVTKLTHNTEYRFRVTAVNTVGPGTPSSESLLYKAAKAAIPEAPVIREPLKDLTAGLKETATLSCIIVGVPQPTLRWFKDDDEFVPKSSSYESGLARLILNNTNEESAGQYSCRASNDSGSCECSCTLIIQEAPKIVPEKKTKVYRLQIEKQWSITAKVTGLPRPDVTWTKNGASIEGNTHYIADVETQSSTACSTTLTIINTERTDTAKYTLTATNVAGTVTHDVTLKISDKPSKPQGPLVAKEVDKTSATMEWKPPLDDGGIELKGYIVEYSEIFTEQWKRVEELSANTICHVQNLTEGLEYVFRVSAVNDVGTSEPLDTGAPVLIKCQFDTPSAPRGPLEFSGMTDTSLVLHWFPPASDGGSPLTEYLVERREVSKKAWQKVGTTDGKTTHIEALGLKQGTSYNFRMTAQNQLGYGPAFTPEDVIVAGKRITPPSPPSNLQVADITSRSVTLQWAPPISTGGAELTGYIIEKMLSGTDKWEKVVTLDPSVTVHCIQNLKERSEFFFRVLTENPMGLSAPAETGKVALKTHATVPSPPTSPLEVRPVGPNSIIVEWGIPESDGGAAIDGYIVAVRDSRKTMWMEVGQVGADTTRLIVKDMQEGHKYYVRVFARNEVGLSEPLETEEPVKVIRPPDYLEPGIAGPAHKDPTASLSLSTETLSSWMRDANMDADIRIYSRSSLLRRDEYFFRVWYYSRQLFK